MMKFARKLLVAMGLIVVTFSIEAQQVMVTGITKTAYSNQTDVATLTSGGYGFSGFIEGAQLSSTYPSGLRTITTPNSAVKTFILENGGWYVNDSFATKAEMDAAYLSGSYTLRMNAASVSVNLTADAYPVQPKATVSAGSWVGGKLRITASEAAAGFTIDTNPSDSNGFVTLEIYGNEDNYDNYVENQSGFVAVQATVPSGALTVGNSYTVEMEFDKVVDSQSAGAIDTGATAFALFSSNTSFQIEVVPDPVQQPKLSIVTTRGSGGATSATISWVSTDTRSWLLQYSTDGVVWTSIGDPIVSVIGANIASVPESMDSVRFFRLKSPDVR